MSVYVSVNKCWHRMQIRCVFYIKNKQNICKILHTPSLSLSLTHTKALTFKLTVELKREGGEVKCWFLKKDLVFF